MYLENEDRQKVIDYLVNNEGHFSSLKPIKTLSKMNDKLLKKFDSEFHNEIEIQYLNQCKLVVAEEISKSTGLAVDGVLYILDYMGLENFKKYLK